MKVARWGNSLAVRLPRDLAEELCLKEGDEISLVRAGEGCLGVMRDARRDELIARMSELSVPLPPDYKFTRDEANER